MSAITIRYTKLLRKTLYIIAGCNGAGKTTAARTIMPEVFHVYEFVNADEIARGLSPFNPESVAIEAGRIMLKRIETLLEKDDSFTIETTLSPRSYTKLIEKAHQKGFNVMLLYFWLNSPELAIERVATRVSEGGHNIPEDVIRRRYSKSINNLFKLFIPICDTWYVYDNSTNPRKTVASGSGSSFTNINDEKTYNLLRTTAVQPQYQITKEKDYERYLALLEAGLKLSEQLMIQEKAANNEDVVVSLDGKNVIRIPARRLLEMWDKLMDKINMPEWKSIYSNLICDN